MIRVVLADDQQLVRAGFRALLEAEPDLEVVGEAATGRAAVERTAETVPDVVLMDIRMPDGDGIEATREIVRRPDLAGVHVVVVTTFELDEYVTAAILSGASGFLLKDAEPTELLRAVRVAADGDSLLSPAITRRLLDRFVAGSRAAPPTDALAALTEWELEVLRLVAEGLSNEEIGARLHLSTLTVKTHVSRILMKAGVRDRVQLVVLAYETGLVRPGWS